ncbi:hypothetical protein QQP08_001214 [Theobroma cacao]|uniref:Uncharacterized protein LOC108662584 n=1 Tax=Theobroma cacao TaxID=3641 RepID=A0AB32WKV1_THECC|nr:PREDICTED: uncharacterized protein LOC108662584 [Theobroma cacao]WRX08727.1 hypothetical protein QQP08_001214 [Theobroma cacao]
MAIISSEEPVISRLDRVDNMLRQLEEIRGCSKSPRSSCASTPSSGTFTSEGHPSSVDLASPSSLEKHCRPIDHVMVETQVKGTLIQRLDQVEDRLLKLCLRLEEELEAEKRREESVEKRPAHKKGIKQFVKQCVKGKHSKHKLKQGTGVENLDVKIL